MKATTQENSDGKRDNYPPPTSGNHLSDRQRLHHCLSRTLTKTKANTGEQTVIYKEITERKSRMGNGLKYSGSAKFCMFAL
jgi:hypothetical protein